MIISVPFVVFLKLIVEKNKEILLREFRATEIFIEDQKTGTEIKIRKV